MSAKIKIFLTALLCVTLLASCGALGGESPDAAFGSEIDGESASAGDSVGSADESGQTGAASGDDENSGATADTSGADAKGDPSGTGQAGSSPSGATGGQAAETLASAPEKIYVYVCGAVENPGVYALDKGDRQVAAIEAAGGFTAEACAEALNLAAQMTDGERLYVPDADEVSAGEISMSGEMNNGGAWQQGDTAAGTALVNINTASADELMTLPGIGASKAQKIIDYREENGGFSSTEDLMNVPGIKAGTYDSLKDLITAG